MRTAVVALALTLQLGCGGEESPGGERAPESSVVLARNPQQLGAPQSALAAAPARRSALPAGEWHVAFANGVVSIDASEAPRRALLEALAQRAGFALEAPAGALPPITLRLDAQPLEAALPRVVGDRDYRTEWELRDGSHRLAKLAIGEARYAASADASTLRPGEVSDAVQRALQERDQALSEAEALRRLKDQDPETRLAAVLALDGEGETLAALAGVLERDPDPRVRAAATVGLEESEEFAAVQALVGALDDPNPEVVVEVIDSLEFAGDASVVPSLKPLLSHSDARVRKAAADAIALLEE